MNDFDETLPGPWEWDVKRLAASFEVAGRNRGFTDDERREINLTVVRGYRERMLQAAESRVLDAWYDRLDADQMKEYITTGRSPSAARKLAKRADAALAKARTKDSTRAVAKLVEVVDGSCGSPPIRRSSCRSSSWTRSGAPGSRRRTGCGRCWRRTSPRSSSRTIRSREFTYVHMARKVVGVGSVGTRAWIVLLRGRDDADPLLLQAKQAEASVLERFLPRERVRQPRRARGRGQRLMQAASDIFLGWHREAGFDGVERDFYIRQLHDWKGSADVDTMNAAGGSDLRTGVRRDARAGARACGRSGRDRRLPGPKRSVRPGDRAVRRDYADQNDRDYAAFVDAVQSGRLEAADSV